MWSKLIFQLPQRNPELAPGGFSNTARLFTNHPFPRKFKPHPATGVCVKGTLTVPVIFVLGFHGQHRKEQIFTGFSVKPVSFRVLKKVIPKN
jgi:hypothetical protein